MVSEETLISCFCDLGCDVPDEAVVGRCLQLCRTYGIDEETFVERWVTYTIPMSLNIDPTLENLDKLEEEELKESTYASVETVADAVSNMQMNASTNEEVLDNVLNIYSTGQPSTLKQTKRARSPLIDTGNVNKIRAVDQTFSPSTFLSKVNVPNRAPSTTVRGKVLLYFGPDIQAWSKPSKHEVSIADSDNGHVPNDVVYMYEMLSKEGAIVSDTCESFGVRLCQTWNETGGPSNSTVRYVKNVLAVSQVAFRTWGRISVVIDKSADSKIVMLEGCRRSKGNNNAPMVRLDLSGVKRYAVFPGQIVAVEGVNTAGSDLLAKELFMKGYASLAESPNLSADLKVYVAVGPFTPSDNLSYQPLWDLVERVAEEEPNILILVGPFVEYTHPEIRSCTLKDTFHDLFNKILSRVMESLQGKSTRVVLVSSNRDMHHDAVYPTPQFAICASKIGSNGTNLHPMPDPCIINVEGLHIGVTSVDIVRHLGQREVSNTPGIDRLARLADHVLSQANFYPVYPPSSGINLDTTLWKKYSSFKQQPHIMILPSDIKYYCKVVNDCLVVNPERLHKYNYAKLLIRPASNGKWDPNSVSCEIGKV